MCSGKDDYTFTSFTYNNGSFVIPTGKNTSSVWFGNVYKTDSERLVGCGSLAGSHCMYFVRECGSKGRS